MKNVYIESLMKDGSAQIMKVAKRDSKESLQQTYDNAAQYVLQNVQFRERIGILSQSVRVAA